MSDEEKKAIERIEDTFYQDLGKGINKFQKITLYEDGITDIRELLNLIEKQQKEIEKKNSLIDVLQHRIEELLDNKKEINYIKPIDIPVHNYISKDKIKEITNQLKEIADGDNPDIYIKIDAYEELLEED